MRQEKQLLLDEVKGMIEHYGSFVIMNYANVNANQVSGFRRQIAELGGDVQMINKRILVKASQGAGLELDVDALPGHIGLVFAGTDALQTAKAVLKFGKDTNNSVSIVGGRFEGQLYNGPQVVQLSALPGKDEMRAQLLSVLIAPMQQTLGVMDSMLCSILYCLENKSKKTS